MYMCLRDDGLLYEGGRPLVFEDVDEAHEALVAAGDEEAFVADIAPETIVQRLRETKIREVVYKPTGEPERVIELASLT